MFLGLSFTVGRRVVSNIIRWTHDTLVIQVPVITAILLIMLAMALTTDLIGVQTALGAFVLGASLRSGGHKFLGPGTEALVRSVKVPIVLVAE